MRNKYGFTPLASEAQKFKPCNDGSRGEPQYISFLLQHGADPNIVDCEGRAALHELLQFFAWHVGKYDALKMLLQAGARNIPDIRNNTPLHYAVEHNLNAAVLPIVIATQGENIDLKNQDGKTALDIAHKHALFTRLTGDTYIVGPLEHWIYECAKAKLCEHYGESGNNHNPSMLKMIQAREMGAKLKLKSSRKNYSSK